MNKFQQLKRLIEDFDNSLGIWGDIIGGICLFAMGIGLFVFVPLFFG